MTYPEARDLLIQFNLWRRDDHVPNAYEMPTPIEIGVAIDTAVEAIEELLNIIDGKSNIYGLKERYVLWKSSEKWQF